MKEFLALVAVTISSAVCLGGGDKQGADKLAWPQFRGPNGSGVAERQKPPIEFGPDKNVKWKIPVPSGLSSPIVAGDKLVITALDGGKLFTIAYNRADGKEAWRSEAPAKKLEAFHKTESSPAASTPATDGERIVTYFGSCGLFCFDLSGKELWKFEMPTAISLGHFGSGVSPILADGVVILVRDVTNDPKIIAVDLASGKLRWEKNRLSPLSYGTPIIFETPAGKQVVAPGHGRLVAYNLKTGDEEWSVSGMPAGCCSSPVAADGIVYFAGWTAGQDTGFKVPSFDELLKKAGQEKLGYLTKEGAEKTMLKGFFENQDTNSDGKLTREEWDANSKFMSDGKNSAFAVKPGGRGDVSTSHVLWKKTKGLPYVASALVYQGQYVMVKDRGIVTALDTKTGNELNQQRVAEPTRYYASPVAANGHIYFTSLEEGVVTVLKAGTLAPEVVATNPKLGERVGATPAIADDAIYIRTAGHLYAFSERK
ncbi:MAG: PQQ-binding-like beta-propeller repeat protein [Planctomycetes bacterium]|nr:PQQ-binding-like beta-propeller repeat protein [Planctomycetota bacterium]